MPEVLRLIGIAADAQKKGQDVSNENKKESSDLDSGDGLFRRRAFSSYRIKVS